MYPALGLPAPPLTAVLEELARRTEAFGVNFIVPFMAPGSLDAAIERAPYVDFFLAAPDPTLVERVHAGGRVCGWQIETAEEAKPPRPPGATSSSPKRGSRAGASAWRARRCSRCSTRCSTRSPCR